MAPKHWIASSTTCSTPFDCVMRLDGRVNGLLHLGEVPALVPLGPKIFALSECIVAAMHHPFVAVWRASFDTDERPIPRRDEGVVCGIPSGWNRHCPRPSSRRKSSRGAVSRRAGGGFGRSPVRRFFDQLLSAPLRQDVDRGPAAQGVLWRDPETAHAERPTADHEKTVHRGGEGRPVDLAASIGGGGGALGSPPAAPRSATALPAGQGLSADADRSVKTGALQTTAWRTSQLAFDALGSLDITPPG